MEISITDNELLQAIYSGMQELKQDIHTLQQDIQEFKKKVTDVDGIA